MEVTLGEWLLNQIVFSTMRQSCAQSGDLFAATTSRRDRRIISPKIPDMANGKRLSRVEKRQIFNCPSRKVQRLFNCIPGSIRNLTGVTTDTFKGHLDKWLKTVPDQPRGGGYSERVAAESNSIQHQAAMMRARR